MLKNRIIQAVNVPPPADDKLSNEFKEISRIHLYFGTDAMASMLGAIRDASLEDIERGYIQLAHASRTIEDYIRETDAELSDITNAEDSAYYFNHYLKETFSHAINILSFTYEHPNNKNGTNAVPYIANLVNEAIVFTEYLNQTGIKVDDNSVELAQINALFDKLCSIKDTYAPLNNTKPLASYRPAAEASIKKQLKNMVKFNYSDMASIHDEIFSKDWIGIVQDHKSRVAALNSGEINVDQRHAQQLKDKALNQFTAIHQFLSGGIVNTMNAATAAISREIHIYSHKNKITPEQKYNSHLVESEKFRRLFGKGTPEDIAFHERLVNDKDEIIAQYGKDHEFQSNLLSRRHRELTNIVHTLNTIKENVLGTTAAQTITFTGDIRSGFVVGTPSKGDNILLVHKDQYVSHPEAVYAMVITNDKFTELLESNKLVFNEEFREQTFKKASNFWSYGQFLEEASNPEIQEFFLGGQFELIDRTKQPVFYAKPKKEDVSSEDIKDDTYDDDIPF